jgi:hypothetical protein
MTQVLFNQFAYTDRLTRGGFTPEQARASAEALETAFSETVATKSDLDRVEAGVKTDIDRVEGKIDRVETSLKADLDRVETSIVRAEAGLKAEIATVRMEMAKFETRIVSEIHATVYKGVGILGAIFGVVALIAKFWK